MTLKNINKIELLWTLNQFTGTDNFHQHNLNNSPSILLTDGIKYLAEKTECYWLIDFIASSQIKPAIREQGFQVWKLKKQKEDGWKITCSDGNHNELMSYNLPSTDFPLDSIKIWLVDKVAMLPSEY